MCGEQLFASNSVARKGGSPPRVRGTAATTSWGNLTHRITPACAGNSHSQGMARRYAEDHPRVCGEQSLASFS